MPAMPVQSSSSSLGEMVYGARDLLSSGMSTALVVGNTVCIQVPKKTLVLCFQVQKKLAYLPFQCISKIYSKVLYPPALFVIRRGKLFIWPPQPPSALELLTGKTDPSSEEVIAAARKVRTAALKAVRSADHVRDYKRRMLEWKMESEKKTEEMYRAGLEDKDLVCMVAATLRCLRTLKVKRGKMNDSFEEMVASMLSSGSVSSEKLRELLKNFKNVEAAIKEKRSVCMNMLVQGERTKVPKLASIAEESGLVQKVVNMVADENAFLKNRLASTHDKMEQVLGLSQQIQGEIGRLGEQFLKMSDLNEELTSLQKKLDEGKVLLKTVQEERDHMKEKLHTLEQMIKEEEDYLGDSTLESGFEDYFCEGEQISSDS